ncbi:Activating signal cointegrator 1 [Quillaja saponaria]|uniref:Activating signal cointegrator 1 n=1 Tax=Quillaja saponaria TaxID=32244 RepID=A0AAD7Q2E9_QUISA|nr:Activating signal cointegrator 1 [Quillaja saponaria]
MKGRKSGNYTNPCLTMHQPWASLLVYGIKRIEGRSWPAPIRGRLWIHAASKVPEVSTIKAMEDFYREIYAVNGISDLKFPEHYPVSRLLGCVEVVGCVKCEELASWEMVPEGVRLEGQTDYFWLCEQPRKLLIPFEMRGYQGVYNLERKIFEAAVRGLTSVESPLPVKFPIPNPRDPFSLKPGSISMLFPNPKASEVEKSSSLSAAIAGARSAATQFSKKDNNLEATIQINAHDSMGTGQTPSRFLEEDKLPSTNLEEKSHEKVLASSSNELSSRNRYEGSS